MKLNLSLNKLASITEGTLHAKDPNRIIQSFVTDSRVISAGDVFWALKGQTHDAHNFIADVVSKGASAVIGERGHIPTDMYDKVDVLEVDNSLLSLQELAKYHRLNSLLKVAAITGSNGKSTTKQMLKSICAQAGETVANMGNFNNQFGVPFSLLEIQPKHKYGVFELGASHPGDIKETASLVVPDVAVLTNVSAAHLEFFKDLETVYQTKTELIDCLAPAGTLIYNCDDEMLARLEDYKGKRISFGFNQNADLRILDTEKFSFTYKGTAYVIDVYLERHDKLNAAAACAAAIALGIFMDQIKEGLLSFTPMPMRMERMQRGATRFILDCYNANPASMQNALQILGREAGGPHIAVLGDMRELGETSKNFHRLVARWLLDNHIEYAFLAGKEMKHAADMLAGTTSIKVHYAQTAQQWTAQLKKLLAQKGGVCLLKASRGMKFENILKEI
ncbi:MAG: UDP-N-acetylmuramoyl-tripeptide--D-alanyl-D-alanine ligase [Elusimicrobiaceae bacterium]|nr:UDP-N-acetylmuramoyl-tripeptide--D-alanyl-D-alanine ligase [Elusimicrobiaceae bacterium]